MAALSMRQFIESGVHYGHKTKRWNPRMRTYIFGSKNGMHVIDLHQTLQNLKAAYAFVRSLAARGETVLFVGTKHQARSIIAAEALRCESFYINERWLGGLMTNFGTVRNSVGRLKQLEEKRGVEGNYEGYIKKEATQMEKQRVKLERALGGIKNMRRLPGAIFVIDCKKEHLAIQEAKTLNIPIVAVVDTNCDPQGIEIVIPGNDDAIRSIQLFSRTISNAILEGKVAFKTLEAAQLDNPVQEKPQKEAKKDSHRVPRPSRGTKTTKTETAAPAAMVSASDSLAADSAQNKQLSKETSLKTEETLKRKRTSSRSVSKSTPEPTAKEAESTTSETAPA